MYLWGGNMETRSVSLEPFLWILVAGLIVCLIVKVGHDSDTFLSKHFSKLEPAEIVKRISGTPAMKFVMRHDAVASVTVELKCKEGEVVLSHPQTGDPICVR